MDRAVRGDQAQREFREFLLGVTDYERTLAVARVDRNAGRHR